MRAGAAALLLISVAGTAAGCTSGSSDSGGSSTAAASALNINDAPSASTAGANDLQKAYQDTVAAVLPSVVQITAGNELGSGIVYDDKGDIVTNAHVVGGERSFKVTMADSSSTLDATLVGSYPTNDLAVIRLSKPPSGLKPASFADSAKVGVGELVLAMGNPLGLSSSVTQGIVSAVGRTVSEPASAGQAGATIPNMVQTSAAINPGNSGGALVDLNDRVVGINTLAAVDSQSGSTSAAPGIGFAIPASTVTDLADQLIKDGKVTNSGRAALGITTRTVLGTGSTGLNGEGAGVVSVNSGGPAANAGLRPGDVITKIDGTAVSTSQSLSEALASKKPGEKVTVTYDRDGASHTAEVTLGTL
ncbi:S1C family serine protease [Phaeacidiphilus oryzae]|uniref:S1C family serine protease n=1 Tax=Phaeacidiphilus oryzae TaxID=348818 RepID=UPI000A4C1A6F|nr:trypsin-like peptidase domain-containing protein [Phaeacidiphilus oryzae]